MTDIKAFWCGDFQFIKVYTNEEGITGLGEKTTSAVGVTGVPAWKQDLERTTERDGRRQDKEQMMARLCQLGLYVESDG